VDLSAAIREIAMNLTASPIDVALVGIGENGHLAFNDPPADLDTEKPCMVVELDEVCRKQQVGEGWFTDISQVAKRAISMPLRQIMKAREIVAVVPDNRRAQAVRECREGKISPTDPGSILRRHPNATVYLATNSASSLCPTLDNARENEAHPAVSF